MTYCNPTGLPSPSNVLQPWINSDWFTEDSRQRGNKVHAAVAADLCGKYAVIESQYRPYFESYLKWKVREKPDIVLVEERLSDLIFGFCGQLDLCCRVATRPGIGVVDFKTSAGLGKAWPIQLAAYEHLVRVQLGERLTWSASVRLRADGGVPKVKYYDKYETRFNLFLSALNLYNHYK